MVSKPATTSLGLRRLPSSENFSTIPARLCIKARSLSMTPRISGLNTLMATCFSSHSGFFSLPFKTPKWTWAIDALAIGVASNDLNIAGIGTLKAFSIISRDNSLENGGTSSCSLASSFAISSGSKSRRVDKTCPNLMKTGPKDSRAKRIRSPRA